ncbi:serine hydrolase [Propionibacteriaceae bacterium Y1685]
MSRIDDVINSAPADAVVSVWAGPLTGEPTFTHRAEETHYAASTIKVPLVLAALGEAEAGRLDLDAPVLIKNLFTSVKDGSPFQMDDSEDSDQEPWSRIGATAPLRWLCRRAIVRSSNLATNLVFETVGADAIAEVFTACGATDSMMTRGIEDAAAREAGYDNRVTARDLAELFRAIADGRAVGPEGTAELRDILSAQELVDGIPAGLPAGTKVEHKTGSITGVKHDSGIVLPAEGDPYVLVVCTSGAGTDEEGAELIKNISAAVWDEQVSSAA